MTSTAPPPTRYRALGLPMHLRSSRRRLVAATYAVLAVLCGLAIAFEGTNPAAYTYAIYAALAVGIFVFGGQGRYGLVKAFLNKPPRPESPTVDLVRLRLDSQTYNPPDAAWRNDERELTQRDLAHYRAYQPLAVAMVLILQLSAWTLHPPRWLPLAVALHILFPLALIASVLAITLPSAIILWNEPDLDR